MNVGAGQERGDSALTTGYMYVKRTVNPNVDLCSVLIGSLSHYYLSRQEQSASTDARPPHADTVPLVFETKQVA